MTTTADAETSIHSSMEVRAKLIEPLTKQLESKTSDRLASIKASEPERDKLAKKLLRRACIAKVFPDNYATRTCVSMIRETLSFAAQQVLDSRTKQQFSSRPPRQRTA